MAASRKILIADDEPDILEILQFNLENEGYEVVTAKDGEDAIQKAKAFLPDLIVLDIMMPKKNGLEVCGILRKLPGFKETFILFLSALGDDSTQVKGFETGADDYINKPISPKVFLSKVNSFFRRLNKEESSLIHINGFTIDPVKFVIRYDNKDFYLAKKEFELLYLLSSSPGRVFLRDEILNQVWGSEVIVGSRTIDVHVRKIRQKLGIDCITTVKGVGYKFEL